MTMTLSQAKKIATAAGLVCEWSAVGQIWRAVNPATRDDFHAVKVVFDAKYLRACSVEEFQRQVNKAAA